MPNKHKNPMLGWNPPAELSAWVRAEAERRGVALKVILDEALSRYREYVQSGEDERTVDEARYQAASHEPRAMAADRPT